MTELLASQGIKAEDYVGDNWTSGEFDGRMYAMTYDVLPTVLFYNRKLIPAGYTEADILSDDFTLDKMIEMMKAAYGYARMNFKGHDVIFAILMLTIMIPGDINLIPTYSIVSKLHLKNTVWALVLPGLGGVGNIFLIRHGDLPRSAEVPAAGHLAHVGYEGLT